MAEHDERDALAQHASDAKHDSPLPKQRYGAAPSSKPLIGKPGAMPAPKPTPAALARTEVLRTSLLLAQHWLDTGVSDLKKAHRRDPEDVAAHKSIALATVGRVDLYFDEAIQTLRDAGASIDRTGLFNQMDETSRALNELAFAADGVAWLSDDSSDYNIRQINAQEDWLRKTLGMSNSPRRGAHVRANKKNDAYEAQAIVPVLDLVRIEAEHALVQLRTGDIREEIIGRVTQSLQHQLNHAELLLDDHEGKNEASTYGGKIQAASVAVLELRRWMSGKQNNKRMMELLGEVVARMDRVRAAIGLGSIMDAKGPVESTQREQESNEVERQDVIAAQGDLVGALATAHSQLTEGLSRFTEFAKFARPPVPTSDWEELAKGVLIAVVGNIVGPAFGILVNKIASSAGKTLADGTMNLTAGSATDSVQSMLQTISSGAVAASQKDQAIRDRQLFKEGLSSAHSKLREDSTKAVSDRVKTKSISSAEIQLLLTEVNKTKDTMGHIAYRQAAHGFALLSARQGMGGVEGPDSKKVSKVGSSGDYFGAPRESLDDELNEIGAHIGLPRLPRPRRGGKQGSTGIGKLTIYIDNVRSSSMTDFEIHGMNGDMAEAVLANAGYQWNKLALPLEVEFKVAWATVFKQSPFGGLSWETMETPMMIVDEAGKVRGSRAWEAFSGPTSPFALLKVDTYSTPERAWASIRNIPIPPDIHTPGKKEKGQ